jgi:hypothetical protein
VARGHQHARPAIVSGALAQLAEHRLCKAGVTGSSPVGSTSKNIHSRRSAVQPSLQPRLTPGLSKRPVDGRCRLPGTSGQDVAIGVGGQPDGRMAQQLHHGAQLLALIKPPRERGGPHHSHAIRFPGQQQPWASGPAATGYRWGGGDPRLAPKVTPLRVVTHDAVERPHGQPRHVAVKPGLTCRLRRGAPAPGWCRHPAHSRPRRSQAGTWPLVKVVRLVRRSTRIRGQNPASAACGSSVNGMATSCRAAGGATDRDG